MLIINIFFLNTRLNHFSQSAGLHILHQPSQHTKTLQDQGTINFLANKNWLYRKACSAAWFTNTLYAGINIHSHWEKKKGHFVTNQHSFMYLASIHVASQWLVNCVDLMLVRMLVRTQLENNKILPAQLYFKLPGQ